MNQENILSDLSFSKIVDIVQGDKKVASNLLFQLSSSLIDINLEIENAEKQLSRLNNIKNGILSVPEKISSHLKIQLPFTVVRDKMLIKVSKDNLEVDINII